MVRHRGSSQLSTPVRVRRYVHVVERALLLPGLPLDSVRGLLLALWLVAAI